MLTGEDLRAILRRIDGRGYKAYKDLRGAYDLGQFVLYVDHIQGDPFAPPSAMRVRIDMARAAIPPELYSTRTRRIALQDYLTRAFSAALREVTAGFRGSGKSGLMAIDTPGQEVLERSSALITPDWVEVRFVAGLPARGRTVLGREAEEMLLSELPRCVARALVYGSLDDRAVRRHVETCEDSEALRGMLGGLGLVAFISDGSILPRRSGVDPRPLDPRKAVPFRSPESLAVEVDLPNRGRVRGMGIPKGVTLIVGGGYHGKSTLLSAIEHGVYNHIPGDGRELVVTDPTAVKIRAEDGRSVRNVDISPFISGIPFGGDTTRFSTDNASGSTSQAANIMEALEAGARVLLIDEDTSATNFMIRDRRMQALVSKDKEPITPFIDRVREMAALGVSTILVLGGSGDYFDVADTVIMMDEYRPVDVTQRAREIARTYATGRRPETVRPFGPVGRRVLLGGFDASRGRRDVKIIARGLKAISFGEHDIDLAAVEQVVDPSQTRFIGDAIHYISERYVDGRRTLPEVLDLLERDLDEKGLNIFPGWPRGDYARPRRFEIAAAINRLRTLRCVQT